MGMQASGGAHDWAREVTTRGHTVQRMRPQVVRPSGQRQQHDANDAAGLGEAGRRPPMRFVPITSVAPHALQALPRLRARQIKARTAGVQHLRGVWAEDGSVIPPGVATVRHARPTLLADAEHGWPWEARAW
jgi:transposase